MYSFGVFQVNAVTEINVTVTLSQLHLCLLLLNEAKILLTNTSNKDLHTPRAGHSANISTVSSAILHSDYCDSGIESINSSINILYKKGKLYM